MEEETVVVKSQPWRTRATCTTRQVEQAPRDEGEGLVVPAGERVFTVRDKLVHLDSVGGAVSRPAMRRNPVKVRRQPRVVGVEVDGAPLVAAYHPRNV